MNNPFPMSLSTAEPDLQDCACLDADQCCGKCPGSRWEPCCLPKDAEDDE